MTPRLGRLLIVLFFFSVCMTAALVKYLGDLAGSRVEPRDLYGAVSSQFQALRSADYTLAYRHTASGIHEKFTLVQYETMARRDYQMVRRAHHIEFGAIYLRGKRYTVEVFFVEGDGQVTPCLYTLVSEKGAWKIEEVEVLDPWPGGHRMSGMRT